MLRTEPNSCLCRVISKQPQSLGYKTDASVATLIRSLIVCSSNTMIGNSADQTNREFKNIMANSKPALTLRDGTVKVTVWANTSGEKTFHTYDVTRSYKDTTKDDGWATTHQLAGPDAIKGANLLTAAYNRIQLVSK